MTWVKGQSGNVKGRPPSTTALAEYIREKVEPKKLVDIAIAIAEDEAATPKDRLSAIKYLSDFAWSKPVVSVEVTPTSLEEQAAAAAALLTPNQRQKRIDEIRQRLAKRSSPSKPKTDSESPDSED